MFKRFGKRRFARPFRRSFKRFRRSSRGFARKKFDLITLFNNLHGWSTDPNDVDCAPFQIVQCDQTQDPSPCGPPDDTPPGVPGCCFTGATFQLFQNALLETFYQDRITIVRIFGDLWYKSLLVVPVGAELCKPNGQNDFAEWDQYAERYAEQITWGLHKFHLTESVNEQVDDRANPQFVYDSTETPWIWQRHVLWTPRIQRQLVVQAEGSVLGCVEKNDGYTVPPTSSGSQPTYNVPADHALDCTISGTEGCTNKTRVISAPEPPWHHWRFNVRKHITLKGDDNLNLQLGVRHPAMPGFTTGWGCGASQGFAHEASNGAVFLRVRAVVRLN